MAPKSSRYGDLARDPEAFAALYEEHAPRVFRHILYMVGSRQEADDLTNETFLAAWKAIDRYEDRGLPIQGWLLRIAHNLAARQLSRRRKTVPIDGFDIEGHPSGCPERVAEANADQEEVRAAILRLPDIQRQVIIWRFLEDMSYGEVESLLGKSKAAIRVIQFRALKRLRQLLEEADPTRAEPAHRDLLKLPALAQATSG